MAPSRDPLVRLGHIRDEIANLSKALEGVTFEVFAEAYVLRRTAEHAVLIISEAVKALSPASPITTPASIGARSATSAMYFGTTILRLIPGFSGRWSLSAFRK